MGAHEQTRARPTAAAGSTATAPSAAPVRRRPVPSRPAVLQVGSVNDPHEAAADRAADAALAKIGGHHDHDGHDHGSGSAVRRSAAPATVGREGGATSVDFTHRIESRRGQGRGLDSDVRRSMEHGFGTSLSGVRIHTDDHAAQAASEIGARAFTTGKDIFFGAGQYRPGTPDGDHVLGHELAHTLQADSATRRISRLWDVEGSQQLRLREKASEVRVLPPRAVFIIKDRNNDPMVVKAEDRETGLASLVGDLHANVTGAKTVRYRKLSPEDTAGFVNLLREQPEAMEPTSWARMATDHGMFFTPYLPNDYATLAATDQVDAIRDAVITYISENYSRGGMYLQAMTLAEGGTAEDAYGAPDHGMATPAKNDKLRGMLETPGHMRNLGKMTTLDFITGNIDRVSGGNWGNYFVNPGGVITVIDNIDSATQTMWSEGRHAAPRGGSQAENNFAGLRPSQLANTAQSLMTQFLDGDVRRWDSGSRAWLNEAVGAGGTTRKQALVAEFHAGMAESRKNFVKVFTSTRWSLSSSGKQARQTKKGLKGSAREAQAVDAGSLTQEAYYDRLKQVAQILKRQR